MPQARVEAGDGTAIEATRNGQVRQARFCRYRVEQHQVGVGGQRRQLVKAVASTLRGSPLQPITSFADAVSPPGAQHDVILEHNPGAALWQ
eukprot:SAG11_NODE_11717_length_742_cov_1.267496_1_plen_91_part_00